MPRCNCLLECFRAFFRRRRFFVVVKTFFFTNFRLTVNAICSHFARCSFSRIKEYLGNFFFSLYIKLAQKLNVISSGFVFLLY